MGERSWLSFWILNVLVYHYCCALRFIMLDVPSPTISGESIELTCSYELGKDKLYSVKWYKNDEEFYRFVPQDWLPGQSLPMPGIKVDLSRSGPEVVYLKNINLHSAGIYRCEVVTEAPDFVTIEESKEMQVFVLPTEGPKIHGSKTKYAVDDNVSLNCTSAKSKPASVLRWSINDQPADPSYETEYLTTEHADGLETSSVGLRFKVSKEHFQSGNMKLKCTATILTIYTMSNEASYSGDRQPSGITISQNLSQEPSSFSNRHSVTWPIIFCMVVIHFVNVLLFKSVPNRLS